MINEKEINISNLSYTNKDFASIYPEQVQFVQWLTDRWDPQTSNESDPGVVLLKENAFIGDKINYNIDKYVLEPFMPSCTQLSSMSMNCEQRGYEMKYYIASETSVTVSCRESVFEDASIKSIVLPKFSTVFTSSSDSVKISYVLIEDNMTFTKDNLVVSKRAIQGMLETLTIVGSESTDKIQLSNLDDNNKIYFPVTQVAQNGVFVSSDSESEWKSVSNLNLELPRKRCFKFGFDSKVNRPYIQFPDDIASIIDSGLTIRYIITDGETGNVKAGYLNSISSSNAFKYDANYLSSDYQISTEDESSFTVKNESASITGRNPESIDEAYNNFKRTVGTFDTLVTCRDYANAIYNLYDTEEVFNIVSNVQVADRRDDINYSVRVSSLDEYGPRMKNYQPVSNDVTAFDLMLYPLRPITSYTIESYDESFTPLSNTVSIEESLTEAKTISHDYKELKPTDLYTIKNFAKLDAKIVTTYKVNNYERATIIENIKRALIQKFNAREVDYGYEIPYDTILTTIQNADSRISFVSLAEPVLSTSYMLADGTEYKQFTSDSLSYFNLVLAKNILNGSISLFDYDDLFNYDFSQEEVDDNGTPIEMLMNEVSYIESHANISMQGQMDTYVLGENEAIQIVGPNIVTDISYSAYIYYQFTKGDNTSINSNDNYELVEGDSLKFRYTDTNGSLKIVEYPVGTIIQPVGFNLSSINSTHYDTVDSATNEYWGHLGAQESINIRKINKVTLDKMYNCYWIRNNATNTLFTSNDEKYYEIDSSLVTSTNYTNYFIFDGSDYVTPSSYDPTDTFYEKFYEIILGDGEYFFYTDSAFDSLLSVGSGTTLRTNLIGSQDSWTVSLIEYDEIVNKGILSLKSAWKRVNFTLKTIGSTGTYLDIVENNIITLTQNDILATEERYASGETNPEITNEFIPLVGEVEYTVNGTTEKLSALNISESNGQWKIRSRLDINASKDKIQILQGANQSVTFYSVDDEGNELNSLTLSGEFGSGIGFNLSALTQIAGGDYVDVRVYDYNLKKVVSVLSVYDYKIGNDVPERDSYGIWSVELDSSDSSTEKYLDVPSLTSENSVIAFYWNPSGVATCNLHANASKMCIFNNGSSETNSIDLTDKGLYVVAISSSITELDISATSGKGVLSIGRLKYYKGDLVNNVTGYNKNLGIDEFVENSGSVTTANVVSDLLLKLKTLGGSVFYYTADIDNSKFIETEDMSSPYALYDYNNVANKFVITEIDIENSNIDVVRSSRI